jgi:hypothetical protein
MAEELLDEIPSHDSIVLDPRTRSLIQFEASRREIERWKAADHCRRRAEEPREAREAAARRRAEERAQMLACIPDPIALDPEEVEPDAYQLGQDTAELEDLGRQMAAESLTRRARLIAYDHHLSTEEAVAIASWEAGLGPKPTRVVVQEAVADDPDLDDLPIDDR